MTKIKFKLSLKELSFEFEGDRDTGEKMQTAIGNTLGSLMETQNQIIDVEARQIKDDYMLPPSLENLNKPRRRRANKHSKTINGDTTATENGNLAEKAKRTNRPKGQSARDQILLLIQNGFFTTYRSTSEMTEEMSKKGHSFDSSQLSTPLIRLTRQNILSRENSANGWQYIKGSVDVPTEG
jgi:hypothetical protein